MALFDRLKASAKGSATGAGTGRPDPRQLAKLVVAVLAVAALLFSGLVRLADARAGLVAARSRYVSAQSEAASLPREERDLQRAKEAWDAEKQNLWRSAETGVAFKDVEEAVRGGGARLLSVEPGAPVTGPFRGHLRAVPVKVGMRGTYPQVLEAVARLERLANPGEVRQFRVSADPKSEVPGEVDAEVELVLYSLNPPEAKERVPGKSGRYDPFFPLVLPEAGKAAPQGGNAQGAGPQGGQSSSNGQAAGEGAGSATTPQQQQQDAGRSGVS